MIETERLRLREFTNSDSNFIIELLNDPDWIRNIGDRHVRTVDDAIAYLNNGPIASYRINGFGMLAVELKHDRVTIGTCGLIKRPGLADVDIGFAFLPDFRRKGFALEAATSVLDTAKSVHNLPRVLAIVLPDNESSVNLVEKLGLTFEQYIALPDDPTPLACYSIELR
jgi:RimJ/RimL family protein N-acetyltransferase